MPFMRPFVVLLVLTVGCLRPPPNEFRDDDGDGFGVSDEEVRAGNGAPVGGDCDDTDASLFPGQLWYVDCDADGAYAVLLVESCTAPVGCTAVLADTLPNGPDVVDCNDDDPAASDISVWYADCDGDGVAADLTGVSACGVGGASAVFDCADGEDPDAWLTEGGTDCDDADPTGVSAVNWYPDCDDDGAFDSVPVVACGVAGANEAFDCSNGDSPGGDDPWSTQAGADCDDDDGANSVAAMWYPDCDGDGAFASSGPMACGQGDAARVFNCDDGLDPDAWSLDPGSDCNDEDPTGIVDQSWYPDCDGDGFAGDAVVACGERGAAAAFTCADQPNPEWSTVTGNDCDDSDPAQFPGQVWYADCDNDGFFDGSNLLQCEEPTPCTISNPPVGGWVHREPDEADCNDEARLSFPGAVEQCDGIQNACGTPWVNDRDIVSIEWRDTGLYENVSDQWQGTALEPATFEVVDPATVHVCRGDYFVELSVTNTNDVVIEGEDRAITTLSGANMRQVASFDRATARMSGLTLTGGSAEDGGLMALQHSDVVLDNLLLIDSFASERGGAAFVDPDSSLTLRNVEASGNTSTGGAVVHVDQGSLVVVDSAFQGNEGRTLLWSGGSGAVENTTFTNNFGSSSAALNVFEADVTVVDCTFTGNTASGRGGAARVLAGSTLEVTDSLFRNNSAQSGGGALLALNSMLILNNTRFEDNTATGGDGGAVVVDGGTLTMTGGYFLRDQSVTGRAGAVYAQNSGALTLDGVTIDQTTASTDGGAISTQSSGSFALTNVNVNGANARAIAISSVGSHVINGGLIADSTDGAVWVASGGGITFVNANFANNAVFDVNLQQSGTLLNLGENVSLVCDSAACEEP